MSDGDTSPSGTETGGEPGGKPGGPGTPTPPPILSVRELTRQWLREDTGRANSRDLKIIRRARRRDRYPLRTSQDIQRADKRLDLQLKRQVAYFALVAVAGELLAANTVFILYAWLGRQWDVPTSAIQVWLAATVVQVIGILYVIARYLFSNKNGSEDSDATSE